LEAARKRDRNEQSQLTHLRQRVVTVALFCVAMTCGARPACAGPTVETLGSGFSEPMGVAVDRSGNVYVADTRNFAVKEIVATAGSIGASPVIKTLGTGFTYPRAIAVDDNGNVYVAEASDVKELVATSGSIAGPATVKTLAGGFNDARGVAVDRFGNVYVADTGNNAVKELVAVAGSIPASPTIVTLGSGLNGPAGVAVDRLGNVYVAGSADGDTGVREIVAAGGSIPASPTIRKLGWKICCTASIAVDARGNVFVSDAHWVKEIGAIDGSVPVSPGIKEVGAGFKAPSGVAVDAAGNVYVADAGDGTVKKIVAAGGIIPAPFVLRVFPWNPGVATTAVALDRSGNLYLSPQDRLIKYLATGASFAASGTTIASGLLVYSGNGVAVDRLGNIWVADWQAGLKEILAVDGRVPPRPAMKSVAGFSVAASAIGVTVDRFGNVYVAAPRDPTDFVEEIVASGGVIGPASVIRTLGSGYWRPAGVAVDGLGNVYVADLNGVKELLAVGGSVPAAPVMRKLWSGTAQSICIDASGNVFATEQRPQQDDAVVEIVAPGRNPSQSPSVNVLVSWLVRVSGIATDTDGNVFVTDSENVYEILAGSQSSQRSPVSPVTSL
jgi:sugar lactone lactonase YvrE